MREFGAFVVCWVTAILINHFAMVSFTGFPPAAEVLEWRVIVLFAVFSGPVIAIGGLLLGLPAVHLARGRTQSAEWSRLAIFGLLAGAIWAAIIAVIIARGDPVAMLSLGAGGAAAGLICGLIWWALVERHRKEMDA